MERCLERGKASGRTDDNEASLKKRLAIDDVFKSRIHQKRINSLISGLLRIMNQLDRSLNFLIKKIWFDVLMLQMMLIR